MPLSPRLLTVAVLFKPVAVLLGALLVSTAHAQAPTAAPAAAPKPAADTIVFVNGDQLSGTLERAVGNSVIFKSDMAGEITVPLDKIKELHSSGSFAVLRKDQPANHANVTPGTLNYTENKLSVAPLTGPPQVVPAPQISYIIDQATYDRELDRRPRLLHGWNGNLNGGATVVRSSTYGETFTAGLAFIRSIPAVPYLPARNRTTFNLQETFGRLTAPVIPQTDPPSPPAVTETSIFHADAERDEYISPRFFALAQTSFDHNFSLGLNLQQIYGVGIGWTPLKTPKQELDLKADLHYERQNFQPPTSDQDLIGSTFSESYLRHLPHQLLFTEQLSILPAWNDFNAYSASGSAALTLPVFKRLSLTLSSTDNFLNNPGFGYRRNSFQFVTAISYTLK